MFLRPKATGKFRVQSIIVDMRARRFSGIAAVCLFPLIPACAQVIEFESGGLKYKALTRNGLTIMVANLPAHVRDYSIVQVAVSNGSKISWTVKPEDFTFQGADGRVLQARPARDVVESLMEKAHGGDIVKLITTYEAGLYGIPKFESTHGYETRRQAALAMTSAKWKAAAAASAIAFVPSKLAPGESTDGAVFWSTLGKALGAGKFVVHAAGELFEFDSDPPPVRN
jgi:hypothetical protein